MNKPPRFHTVTPKNRETMKVIGAAIKRHGLPPSIAEVSQRLLLCRRSGHARIEALQGKGILRKNKKGEARALALTMPPRIGDLVLVATPKKLDE